VPLNVSNNTGGSQSPAIAVDAGTIHLAWYDDTPGNWEIVYSKSTDGGITWSAPVNVSNNTAGSYTPKIAVEAGGTIHVVWQDWTPGNSEIFYSKSTDGGITWSAPVNVSNNAGNQMSQTIAVDAGIIYLAWWDSGNREIFYSNSSDGGFTWSTPVNASNTAGNSVEPAIAVDAGTIYLAWADDTPGNREVLYSKSIDGGGTWSASVNVSNNSGVSQFPSIAIDSSNNLHVVWMDNTPGNMEIFYSNSTDGGTTWSAAVNASNSTGESSIPVISIGAGTIYLAWYDDTPANSEIFYSKSTDGGATWSAVVNISNNIGSSYAPTIAADGGTIHLAWYDDTPANSEIFYSKNAPDTQPPSVGSVVPATVDVGVSTNFNVTASDSAGVTDCTFYWNGSLIGSMGLLSGTNVSGGWNYSYSPLNNGTQYAWANCSDAAGNTNKTNTTITVNAAAGGGTGTGTVATAPEATFAVVVLLFLAATAMLLIMKK
jgi:hypothetical protein